MKRLGYFIMTLLAASAIFLAAVTWYVASYPTQKGSVAGMMGQMMGSQYAYGMTTPMSPYLWAFFAVLLVAIVGGVAGVAYFVAFPEIETTQPPGEPSQAVRNSFNESKVDWSVLLRTSKPEEKRVLEVIASHEGKYLQKFIVKEAGLSRLKTHRIVSRLAERGIVGVERSGNTNEVSLAPWLKPKAGDTKA